MHRHICVLRSCSSLLQAVQTDGVLGRAGGHHRGGWRRWGLGGHIPQLRFGHSLFVCLTSRNWWRGRLAWFLFFSKIETVISNLKWNWNLRRGFSLKTFSKVFAECLDYNKSHFLGFLKRDDNSGCASSWNDTSVYWTIPYTLTCKHKRQDYNWFRKCFFAKAKNPVWLIHLTWNNCAVSVAVIWIIPAWCVSAGVLGVTDAVREISLDNSKVCVLLFLRWIRNPTTIVAFLERFPKLLAIFFISWKAVKSFFYFTAWVDKKTFWSFSGLSPWNLSKHDVARMNPLLQG